VDRDNRAVLLACCSAARLLAAHRYGVSARVWLAVHTPKERVGLSPAACCLAAATNHTHTHTHARVCVCVVVVVAAAVGGGIGSVGA